MKPQPIYVWPVVSQQRVYALGHQTRGGFRIRRVVFGRLAARMNRESGDEIRRAIIQVERRAMR